MSKASEARLQDALAVARAGDGARARALLETAYRLDPRHAGIRNALAVLRLESGNAAGAVPLLESLVRELPNVPAIRLNFGNALVATGQAPRAVGVFERAVSQQPDDPLLWYGLGRAQQTAGDPAAAVHAYERTLRLNPAHPDARANLAAAYNFLGDLAAGEREARRALQQVPGDPGATFNLAVALLSTAQWAEGWAAYEARQQTRMLDGQRRSWAMPRWSGQGHPGDTILVHAEQGFGDTIQFVRYLPLLKARGFRVVLQCPLDLVDLIRASAICDEVQSFAESPLPHQWQIPLTSLPFALGLHDQPQVIGDGRPYLRYPPASSESMAGSVSGERPRIGLVWSGSPTHVNDVHRSCPFADLAPLWSLPDVTWVNLQLGSAGQIAPPDEIRMVDVRSELTNFAATARVLSGLDAVISIDSAVAHLAGALGVRSYVLLPHIGCDWRWLAEDATHRWYRSMTTVRRAMTECWSDTVARVVEQLRQQYGGG